MGSVGRYIFRTTFGAFLVVLTSVTALMWITQALRNIDLMTSQGQNMLVFIGITGLIIPLLVLLIAPIALMIAVAHILNRLGNDSELIVMNAAGMSPRRVFMPFAAVGVVVSLIVAVIAFYVSPKCLRELRRWATEVRAEVVTNNIQPGQFLPLEGGKLTIHVRERKANGTLVGVMVDDQRDPKERTTIVAENGDFLTNERGVYMILQNGTVQRQEVEKRDPNIVRFKDYAFDLSRLSAGMSNIAFSPQERLPSELFNPSPDDPILKSQPGALLAELHNRITSPLYPLAFLVITFAYLGAPRTTRQSRAMSLVSATLMAAVLRAIGFVGAVSGARYPALLFAPYLALLLTFALGLWGITRGLIIEPPAFIMNAIEAVTEAFARRFAQAKVQTT
jgi:lipopolysaccharide export system permease protein